MFWRQRQYYHSHGLFFILSLVAAFILGRKSEQYGYTIVSRGHGYSNSDSDSDENNEMDMMGDSQSENTYQS
ncbi:hypothetical protein Desaci_1812 [Desulfosporosinus acidiphilus SJ4]|uniref:Uncharacterized protein n=1 Tax=Desulfosporosinus acidiphilus (strain DSM 22704 / JCM 16185 / SJ4) TaxID=646529 RepID=I4D4S5_DESAJ|nr:hypothetical protein [Desulfosporosinus acidiphilus]AFM40799.1 hypothetical protein Desaci_1812 [Desulfosporosinus acidiphilus SJ4]